MPVCIAMLHVDAANGKYDTVLQDMADAANGENILVVSHWDAVSGSVARLRPWTISDHVVHTGFTVAWREQLPGSCPPSGAAPSPLET